MKSTDERRCPDCGTKILADGTGCPTCLLRLAMSIDEPDVDAAEPVVEPPAPTPHAPDTSEAGGLAPPPGFLLGEVLGEGGMGVVYRAEQTDPIRRDVAIKVIRTGLDGDAVLSRFDRERQALALMDHPAIARVYEAGSLPTGRPYVAMEYVDGERITTYADGRGLDTRQRLELFAELCDGVQHAHHKGVIHRDLKPSNVLVTEVDDRATPKIIDFGIARATEPALDATLTELGVAVGTPQYMSPEQAGLSVLGVDTRTDVYSLGVMLYELITGELPFDGTGVGLDGLRRAIREDDPPTPSARVRSGDATTTASFAKRCGTDTYALVRRLEGDLDWITMKALSKEPDRRYATCSELADDVRAHLADLPVRAGPPDAAYRLRKFARRHRLGVAVAATGLVATIGFAGVTTWQNRVIAQERDTAERALDRAERVADFLSDAIGRVEPDVMGIALWDDLASRVESARRARGEPADRVASAREDLAALLAGVDATDVARRLLDRDMLATAGATIGDALHDDPRIAARLELTLSRTYRGLGLYGPAETHVNRAREILDRVAAPDDPERVETVLATGSLLIAAGRYDDAEPFVAEAVERTARSTGKTSREAVDARFVLGELYKSRGDLDDAKSVHLEVLGDRRTLLGPDDPDTLASLRAIGRTLIDRGEFEAAETHLREALERSERLYPEGDRAIFGALSDVGTVLEERGDFEGALTLQRDLLERRERTLGRDHPETLATMNNVGGILRQFGRLTEAESLYRDALEAKTRVLGPDHPSTLTSKNNLGALFRSWGRLADAETEFRESWERRLVVLGPDHRNTLSSQSNLADILNRRRKWDEADRLLADAVPRYRRTLGSEHPDTAIAIWRHGELRERQGRIEEAEALFRETIAALEASLGETHGYTINAHNSLAWLHQASGSPRLAEPHFRDVLRLRRATAGEDHTFTAMAKVGLARCLADQELYDEAERLAREAVAVRREHVERANTEGLGGDDKAAAELDWRTAESLVLLGRALVGLERYGEAETVLLEAMPLADTLPSSRFSRRDEAFDAIVSLYERQGRSEEAANWRARRGS